MSNIKKPGGQDDEKSAYVQEAEAKETSALKMHADAKVAFRGAEWHARDAERTVEQSRRPMKDMPANPPPTGGFHAEHASISSGNEAKKSDDEGDSDGDEGTSGKGGKGGGGKSPTPDLTLDTSGYTAFADTGPKEGKADKGKKGPDTDGPDSGVEGTGDGPLPTVENKIDGPAKPTGPKGSSPKSALTSAAPSAPSSGAGGKSGGSGGPAKSGPGMG